MKTTDIERYLTDYSRISSGNKSKFEKLSAVLSQMQKAGIDCILLKGADLIPRLYGVLGARPLGDADLLVHESDLPAIDHLLTHLGYRPLIDGNPAYVDPDNILALDIITKVWYLDDQQVIWRRAVQRDFEGIPSKGIDRKSTRLNSSHGYISYAVFCLKKKNTMLVKLDRRGFHIATEPEALCWDKYRTSTARLHFVNPTMGYMPLLHALIISNVCRSS